MRSKAADLPRPKRGLLYWALARLVPLLMLASVLVLIVAMWTPLQTSILAANVDPHESNGPAFILTAVLVFITVAAYIASQAMFQAEELQAWRYKRFNKHIARLIEQARASNQLDSYTMLVIDDSFRSCVDGDVYPGYTVSLLVRHSLWADTS